MTTRPPSSSTRRLAAQFLVKRCDLGHFSEPAAPRLHHLRIGDAGLDRGQRAGAAGLLGDHLRRTAQRCRAGRGRFRTSSSSANSRRARGGGPASPAPTLTNFSVGDPLRLDFERPEGADESLPVFRLAR